VEPAVDRWRERYDSMASLGVPAHITVLYPWIPTGLLTDDDHLAVADIAAGTDPIDVTFAAVGRFPDVLWLDPQPRRPILALIAAVSARWPDYPPYGGRYGDAPVPHLTVADVDEPDRLAPVVADLERALPISATISELTLVVRQADGWSLDRSFPFRR
jgi:2'-5' RNA ligase